MEKIIEADKQLFLYLNSFHTDWLDPVMLQITYTQFWVPLYLFLIYLIFKYYSNKAWIILAGVGVAILLSDQITSSLMKPLFARFRPSHEPSLQGMVHHVNEYKGGLYGFASSHAANTFATALFIWLLFKTKYRWIAVLFIWATVVSYTRVYLGVHYPGDIVIGSLIGLLCGWVGYRFYLFLDRRIKFQTSPTIP